MRDLLRCSRADAGKDIRFFFLTFANLYSPLVQMSKYSTRQAAKKLGIGITTLKHYIELKKVPAPKPTIIGQKEVRAWSEADIEKVRELLPKIANGRKTRWERQRAAEKKKQGPQRKTPASASPKKK